MSNYIHPSAEISSSAIIGSGTKIWHQAQVREGAKIGMNCNIGKGVYIDIGVTIGNNVKIQNYVSVFQGVLIEDGVFVGPHACFINDLRPRAINSDGSVKSANDWQVIQTLVRRGASIGANSTILCGITIGNWAMIGAGSVVTQNVPDHGLVFGHPSKLHGFVCRCGNDFELEDQNEMAITYHCPDCSEKITIPRKLWESVI